MDHPIDRYVFHLSLARAGVIDLEPDPTDLDEGSVTYLIEVVDDDRPVVSLGSSPSSDSTYMVTFHHWDPETRGGREPTIHITWDADADGERDILPGGLYGNRVSLRTGADSTGWFMTPYEY